MSRRKKVNQAELIRTWVEVLLQDVHVSVPARVVKYDAGKQRAEVLPLIRKPLVDEDDRVFYEDLPVIPSVPVIWPRGNGYGLHVELKADASDGDTIQLVFSDQSYSEWRSTGKLSSPKDVRRHGVGYPVGLPGFAPDGSPLGSLSGGGMRLGKDNADQQIRIDGSHVDVGVGGAAVAQYAFSETLANALKAFCDNARDRGDGNPWTTVSDVAAAAGTLKTALGGATPTLTTVTPFGTTIGRMK